MLQRLLLKIAGVLLLATPLLIGQQVSQQQAPQPPPPQRPAEDQYVGRFIVYTGYLFLDSPAISLFEPGIHFQAGMRWSRHISVGFDYTRSTGSTTVGLNQATTAIQNRYGPLVGEYQAIDPSFVAALPFHSVTQTFAAGPEFPYRRWKRITPYIRPSAGLINEVATSTATDFILKKIVAQIVPSGKEEEWTLFYGFGGGVALNVTRHFSLIVQADLVHDHLFPDLLRNGRNTVRFSIGPGFQFGGNVTKKWGIPGHWE